MDSGPDSCPRAPRPPRVDLPSLSSGTIMGVGTHSVSLPSFRTGVGPEVPGGEGGVSEEGKSQET